MLLVEELVEDIAAEHLKPEEYILPEEQNVEIIEEKKKKKQKISTAEIRPEETQKVSQGS